MSLPPGARASTCRRPESRRDVYDPTHFAADNLSPTCRTQILVKFFFRVVTCIPGFNEHNLDLIVLSSFITWLSSVQIQVIGVYS